MSKTVTVVFIRPETRELSKEDRLKVAKELGEKIANAVMEEFAEEDRKERIKEVQDMLTRAFAKVEKKYAGKQ